MVWPRPRPSSLNPAGQSRQQGERVGQDHRSDSASGKTMLMRPPIEAGGRQGKEVHASSDGC